MHDDLAAKIAALNALRPTFGDAWVDAQIAALRAEPIATPDTQPAPAGDRITVGDITDSNAVAVGDGARATVYIDGRQGKNNEQLLAAYYQRLAQRCRSVPLQGIYEQRTTTDSLTIDLDHVYTQLATTDTAPREHFPREALADFDAARFLAEHTGDQLLPQDLRTQVLPTFPDGFGEDIENDEAQWAALEQTASASQGRGKQRGFIFVGGPNRIDGDSGDRLARYAKVVDELTFLGPAFVTEMIAASPHLVLLGEPGSGKSTALRYLAYLLACAGLDPQTDLATRLVGWTAGRLLPIFAPLLPLAMGISGRSSPAEGRQPGPRRCHPRRDRGGASDPAARWARRGSWGRVAAQGGAGGADLRRALPALPDRGRLPGAGLRGRAQRSLAAARLAHHNPGRLDARPDAELR